MAVDKKGTLNDITRFFYRPVREAGVTYLGYIQNMYSGKRLFRVRLKVNKKRIKFI